MTTNLDATALARSIAEIASETNDAETARHLMELVQRLLRESGLQGIRSTPPDD